MVDDGRPFSELLWIGARSELRDDIGPSDARRRRRKWLEAGRLCAGRRGRAADAQFAQDIAEESHGALLR